MKAIDYVLAKDYEKAITLYLKELKSNDSDKELLHNIGSCYFCLKRYEESLKYYEKALIIDKLYFRALHNKGISLYKLGRINESIKTFSQILEGDLNAASLRKTVANLNYIKNHLQPN